MTPTSRKTSSPQSLLFALQTEADSPAQESVSPQVESRPGSKLKAETGATPAAWITAYTDGGSRGNPGPAGYGVVLQDAAGVPLAELSEFLGIQTNNVAEYSAMLGALAYALEHGHEYLRVISDSELMVKQMRGQYSVKSPDLRPLYEEARRRVAQLEKFEIQHVLRGKNRHADQLANEAMDRGMKRHPSASGKPEPPPGIAKGRAAAPATASTSAAPSPVPPIPIVRAGVPVVSAPTRPLRGVVRNGAIQLGENALPEGTVVIIMPEDALRGPR